MESTRTLIAARLRDARQAIGLTQAQVAEQLGLHRPAVSEMEAGRRAITSEELYELSQLLEVPVATLLEGGPEDQVEAVLFRKGEIAGPEARLAVRRFVQRCVSEKELEDMFGIQLPAGGRPTYQFRTPRSVWDAVMQGEDLAARERRRLGLGLEPVRNPIELLQQQGIRVGALEGADDQDLDGVYFESPTLGPCVGINPGRDPWTGFRLSFTVAHEYLHWLLSDTKAEQIHVKRFRKDLREVRANSFAAAFLMPREALIRYFSSAGLMTTDHQIATLRPADIVRTMDYFGVSREALQYRLRALKLLPERQWEELRRLHFSVTAVARALRLQLRIEFDLDDRFTELVVRAWTNGLITTGRAADLLGYDLDGFKAMMAEAGLEPDPGEMFAELAAA
jgi:Zn-dependent peptidase ImmA (M78 family)/transcriptional regulator with XRE-family HTH domain